MTREKLGPVFKIISSCEECSHLKIEGSVRNDFPKINKCDLLGVNLHRFIPSSDCPFSSDNELQYHKEKIQEFSEKEWIRFRDSFLLIFKQAHDFEFEENNYKNELSFQCYSLSLFQIKEFDESFPDYNLTFAVYDLNNLIVTVTKRK